MELKSCLVSGCGKTSRDYVVVHLFPENEIYRQRWKEFVQKTCPEFTMKKFEQDGICSLHFKKNEYKKCRGNLRTLRDDAVPSIYPEHLNRSGAKDRDSPPVDRLAEPNPGRKPPNPALLNSDVSMMPGQGEITAASAGVVGVPLYGNSFKMTARRVNFKRASSSPQAGAPNPKQGRAAKVVLQHSRMTSSTLSSYAQHANVSLINSGSLRLSIPSSFRSAVTMAKEAAMPLEPEGFHCREAMEALYAMQQKGKCCDFTLCVTAADGRNETIEVHRSILETASKKVRQIKQHTMIIMHSNLFSVRRVVEFVYTGEIKHVGLLKRTKLLGVCLAAHIIGVIKCVEYLNMLFPGQRFSGEHMDTILGNPRMESTMSKHNRNISQPKTKSNVDSGCKESLDDSEEDIEYIHVECDTTDTSGDED